MQGKGYHYPRVIGRSPIQHLGGQQPKWPLVLHSFPLPHAFNKSMYLEVIAVLHYNNHDGVIHACALKACVSSK